MNRQRNPEGLEALCGQALALHQAGRRDEARRLYQKVLLREPAHLKTLHLLGTLLAETGQPERAVDLLRRSIRIDPSVAAAHSVLGAALNHLDRYQEALASLDAAVALAPGFGVAHYNRGVALMGLRRLAEAAASYEAALALNPNDPAAHNNRGVALAELGRHEAALASYDQAIALDPAYADARANRAAMLLLLGRYEEGWREFEWRKAKFPHQHAFDPGQAWLGETDICGRRLLVYAEWGLGDTIQFARYVPRLAKMGAKVILRVQPALKSLMHGIEESVSVFGDDEPLPPFDLHCSVMSLPLAFRTTLRTIPATVPYLRADAAKVALWTERLAASPARLKVGLVWAGNPRRHDPAANAIDKRRSLSLAQFAPLASVPGLELFSLQKGDPARQARRPPPGLRLTDWTSELHDFTDTAALAASLDLVVTVDTSVAHLVGAMGKPVWILSRFDGCWRWLAEGDDSPWYPTARLFRQKGPGEWDEVQERLARALARFAP